jgi:hypothetical protein
VQRLTGGGAVAQLGCELAGGVGLVGQPWRGLRGAGALWGFGLPGWIAISARGSRRWTPALGYLAGLSLGAAALHYILWPVQWRRGLPVLRQAEGLRAGQLPAYNAILYAWAAVAAGALVFETPRRSRSWALPGFLTAMALQRAARAHFVWIEREAATNPAWWNRAFGAVGGRGSVGAARAVR